ALNPPALTLSINCWVTFGLPQAFSPHWASSVLPMFQPILIWPATAEAVGRVVCAWAVLDASESTASTRATMMARLKKRLIFMRCLLLLEGLVGAASRRNAAPTKECKFILLRGGPRQRYCCS